jgi:hypothetical protein
MTDADYRDRQRDMEAFANAGPIHPAPAGHALARQTHGVPERIIGAQPVAVHRDDQRVLQKIAAHAAAAGTDWTYRFPVRKKEGGQDWIEGPSIKLALAVASLVGNNQVEIREIDVGDAWVFYARYTDVETGFSLERSYRQRKGQQTMRTRDADRSLDIVYQIGQSKALRNVICNACGIFCDYAFEQATNSLVEKIGKSLDGWRERTIIGIQNMPCELNRVERMIGKSAKNWTAPDIARVVAMMQSVADGMTTIDDVFPPLDEKTEPRGEAAAGSGVRSEERESTANTDARESAARDEAGDQTRSAAASAEADGTDAILQAYERGKWDKANGHQRRAMPPEYRSEDRGAEAEAWARGFDGRPLE